MLFFFHFNKPQSHFPISYITLLLNGDSMFLLSCHEILKEYVSISGSHTIKNKKVHYHIITSLLSNHFTAHITIMYITLKTDKIPTMSLE